MKHNKILLGILGQKSSLFPVALEFKKSKTEQSWDGEELKVGLTLEQNTTEGQKERQLQGPL